MNSKKTSEKLARQLSAMRHKKVLALKSRISSGRYKVDNATLAKALFLSQ